jgi:hypothetical protein
VKFRDFYSFSIRLLSHNNFPEQAIILVFAERDNVPQMYTRRSRRCVALCRVKIDMRSLVGGKQGLNTSPSLPQASDKRRPKIDIGNIRSLHANDNGPESIAVIK